MDGQPDSFDEVFSANYALIVRYAERRLPTTSLAEDVAAETFAAAWIRWSVGEGVELPWLYRVAANKVVDHYRSSSRRQAIEEALARAAGEAHGELDWLDRIALQRALLKLAARDREVIMLTYWEGLSASDIAVVIDASVASVWATLSRARKKLRAALEDSADHPIARKGGIDGHQR
ncbi:RNA polymerase sigma factor [Microbacterium terregens]|uniref:RNA polymerase sigma factor n=1 Tax=Microbacterium terregens TaxID=69363 RepID=A0ABV5SX93_9MICO